MWLTRYDLARRLCHRRYLGLRHRRDGSPSPSPWRSPLVRAILDNLLSNAIRYTPAGGRIDLRLQRRQRELVVAVRDTGVGIAPEHQRRVFDRLYRVDDARDRVSGGSGLGLAIAQRAARALGGRLELESEPGRGSEFRLVLPAGGRRRGSSPTTGPPSAEESEPARR